MVTWKPALATAVLVAVSVLSGCGATALEDEPLDGVWTGSIMDSGETLLLTFQLGNAGSVVTGTGSFTVRDVVFTGDVTGSYFHPDVRLSWILVFDDTVTLKYVGQRSSVDLISGTLTADGDTDSLVLSRTSRE